MKQSLQIHTYFLFTVSDIYGLGLFVHNMSHRNGPEIELVFHPAAKQWKYNLK